MKTALDSGGVFAGTYGTYYYECLGAQFFLFSSVAANMIYPTTERQREVNPTQSRPT